MGRFSVFGQRDQIFKTLWISLMALSLAVALWSLSRLSANLYSYFHYSLATQGKVTQWEVVEKEPGEFILVARYRYAVKGDEFQGRQEFKAPVFNNPHSAQQALRHYQSKNWTVWIAPSKPHHSKLQKQFSIQLLVQSLISMGVVIYFIWMREYVASFLRVDGKASSSVS